MTTKHHDRFGVFGGRYVPETLIPAIDDLEQTMHETRPLNHLWINEALRSLLSQVRTTVDRLWAAQCAYLPCVAGSRPERFTPAQRAAG